jgi:hypothetical protein
LSRLSAALVRHGCITNLLKGVDTLGIDLAPFLELRNSMRYKYKIIVAIFPAVQSIDEDYIVLINSYLSDHYGDLDPVM